MTIRLYDKVKLKNGLCASIVEIYEPGVAYEADIDYEDEIRTETISADDIDCVIEPRH